MFYYEVEYWDDIDGKQAAEKGIADAKTYGEAANQVSEFYGKDNVSSVKISELESILTWDELTHLLS